MTSANRVHKFTDNEGNAELWARKIADVTAATEPSRTTSRSSFRKSDAMLKDISGAAVRRNSRDMSATAGSEKAAPSSPTRPSVSVPAAAATAASPSSSAAPRASLSPVRPSLYTINPEWNRLWGRFVPAGKNVVYTSQIGKCSLALKRLTNIVFMVVHRQKEHVGHY